MRLGGGGCIDR